MKRDFADLIRLSCHCDSYNQKISLPGVQTSKTGACKGAANGISQVPFHLVFTSHMSSWLAPTLRNLWESISFPKAGAFWESICCDVWDTALSLLLTSLEELMKQHNAQRSWWPSQRSVLGVILSITVLLGDLSNMSHILGLIYATWLTRPFSVHSAQRCLQVWLRHLCGEILFWRCLRVGYVRSGGSSECLLKAGWTQGQPFSTKH